jgi:tetratricopeptide (TPR) repeat protein
VDSTVRHAIGEGTASEERGDHRSAARHYEKALAACPPEDRHTRGALTINLGRLAERRADPGAAVGYYAEADELLAGGKGEAMLQHGHALMSLGRSFIDAGLPQSVGCYSEAVRVYAGYPYTPLPDSVEARMALIVATASFSPEPIDAVDILDVWRAAQQVASADLHPTVVLNFLSPLLALAQAQPVDLDELEAWVGDRLYPQRV